jgi:hypothetical protein
MARRTVVSGVRVITSVVILFLTFIGRLLFPG